VCVDGRVSFALDGGDAAIPTMVYVPTSGPLVVGREALRLGFSDPFNVVTSVKRLLGLGWGDPALRALDAGSSFALHQGPGGQVLIRIQKQELAPVQLAAAVLARLRKLAEARFGGSFRRAVFTVPAQRPAGYGAALTLAARLTGLEVIDQVPEPVAGFVAQGLDRPGERRVAVVDFGGGTFDATLMEQRGLRFASRAIGGDGFLGGDDLDHALADAVDGVLARKGRRPLRNDQVKWRQLLWRSESVKRQLSSAASARLQLRDRLSPASDIDLSVDRAWIEPRWQSLVDRGVGVVRELLARAG
jgi:molecular chaperone DnaK